jgi:hypothetical protein
MPNTFVREHVADMMGASKAYTGSWDMSGWMSANLGRQTKLMHPESLKYLMTILADELGYEEF